MNREEHLLSCLAEECCEVGQRVSKALRFTLDETQPGQPLTNAERIVEEIKDLITVAEMLCEEGAIPNFMRTMAEVDAKRAKVERFIVYAETMGAVQPAPAVLPIDGKPDAPA